MFEYMIKSNWSTVLLEMNEATRIMDIIYLPMSEVPPSIVYNSSQALKVLPSRVVSWHDEDIMFVFILLMLVVIFHNQSSFFSISC